MNSEERSNEAEFSSQRGADYFQARALAAEARIAAVEATVRNVALRFGREYGADSPSAMAQDITEHVAAVLAASPTPTGPETGE